MADESCAQASKPVPATRVRSVERVHTRLRNAIMSGDYTPGTVLSQVQLARTYGVSRTPLREAIRRLEAEGLIDAVENRRARVATLDAESLDVKFTERILVEAMGVKVTVPFLDEIDLNDLLSTTAALRIAVETGDAGGRDRARRSLHVQYVARAGAQLRATIARQFDSCERYRRLYVDDGFSLADDYGAIAGCCVARDADAAALSIARLEARIATGVLREVSRSYEPIAIRTALQMLAGRPGAPG